MENRKNIVSDFIHLLHGIKYTLGYIIDFKEMSEDYINVYADKIFNKIIKLSEEIILNPFEITNYIKFINYTVRYYDCVKETIYEKMSCGETIDFFIDRLYNIRTLNNIILSILSGESINKDDIQGMYADVKSILNKISKLISKYK